VPPSDANQGMTTDPNAQLDRSAVVLLHPTSLPSRYGIGDLGPAAYAWVDALARTEVSWWQTLPLGPTGYGDSPYQSFSTFAGNPYLISPDRLFDDGLLYPSDVSDPQFPVEWVDYGSVIPYKLRLLEAAWKNFQGGAASHLRGEFDQFSRQQAAWLNDFALFMALKDKHVGRAWQEWEPELVQRELVPLALARHELRERIDQHRFRQFLFFRQWAALKAHANRQGVRLIGDVPIFVAADSADLWANANLFLLDERRRPTVVAGVPPDYFSPTGQLWGNPLYDWSAMKADGYRWWAARLRATLAMVDKVRLDHFRGLEAAWHVPAGAITAQGGQWVPGPADDLLAALRSALGGLPLIAEDLGEITPPVRALRDRFGLPGMRILQFAFDKPENLFLPHNYVPNTVVYTGTHDNDTTLGWFRHGAQPHERQLLERYLGPQSDDTVVWSMIRMAWASVADYAVAPLQDLLNLGTDARMNFPGKPAGNWLWRFRDFEPVYEALGRLRELTELYNRRPPSRRAK
jgi:4-alpha-glucanotransferase